MNTPLNAHGKAKIIVNDVFLCLLRSRGVLFQIVMCMNRRRMLGIDTTLGV